MPPRSIRFASHAGHYATARASATAAAPMPGLVVGVAVKAGQEFATCDPLAPLEAMKMDTVIRAEQSGQIQSVLVGVGAQVEAHDLLIELRSPD